jgi:YbbR domain-containing protein
VVIVSEERGDVSLALAGSLEKVESPETLSEKLHELLAATATPQEKQSLRDRLVSNFWPKMITVGLVLISWLIITVRQGGVVSVMAPIKFHNLPEDVILLKSSPEEVEVQLNVFSSLISSPKQLDIVADINLAKVKEGGNTFPIRTDDFNLPLGVVVTGVNPSTVRVTADRKIQKLLKVKVRTVGKLPGRQRLRRIVTEPPAVLVEGPAGVLEHLGEVESEPLDLSTLNQGGVVEKPVQRPAPQVRIVEQGQLKVRVITTDK